VAITSDPQPRRDDSRVAWSPKSIRRVSCYLRLSGRTKPGRMSRRTSQLRARASSAIRYPVLPLAPLMAVGAGIGEGTVDVVPGMLVTGEIASEMAPHQG